MPLQNRITPFGELIATPARGTFTGNRGILHDAARNIRRHHAGRRWIICVIAFRGWRRTVMSPNRWTELFFLDEATALAAGHRPCAFCQHARYREFVDCWARGNPQHVQGRRVGADLIDAVLHAERLAGRAKRTYGAMLSTLPDGSIVVPDGDIAPHLLLAGRLHRWSLQGYAVGAPSTDMHAQVLTPMSIVAALAAGFVAGHGVKS